MEVALGFLFLGSLVVIVSALFEFKDDDDAPLFSEQGSRDEAASGDDDPESIVVRAIGECWG